MQLSLTAVLMFIIIVAFVVLSAIQSNHRQVGVNWNSNLLAINWNSNLVAINWNSGIGDLVRPDINWNS